MERTASGVTVTGAKRRAAVRRELTAWSFVVPALVGLIIFVYGPLVYSLFISFTSWDLLTPARWTGLSNYARAFRDDTFIRCMSNTVFFVISIVPSGIVLAMAMAIALNRRGRGTGFFRAAFYMPSITSTVAVGLVWLWIFNPDKGVINSLLKLVGVRSLPQWLESVIWAKPALSLMRVWQVSGYYMIMYLTGLQNIPKELYEAAEIDGAGAVKKFLHLTLPLLAPTTFFLTITGIISSFKVFGSINVMTKGGPGYATYTILYYIYTQAFERYRMGYASAMAWMLFAILFVITIIQFRARNKREEAGY
ncbi:MAG: Lactose transport system permease protein LacF [Firmicutes bacterium ADurb.Bin506]|nr:MAG: Lactose transport system permease protein LacF [Firmicutes bacterium ADurb.Bin506]